MTDETAAFPAAIEAVDLSVAMSGEVLLPSVSFSVAPGEAVAVTGPNGSGKTTLLRAIAGLLPATSGSVRVHGRPVDERDPDFRRAVAGLIGQPPVARDLTLGEHLALVAVSWGASIAAGHERAAELLETTGIAGLRDRFPHEMSSGQSQLFSLALLLARPCDILLVDEPEQRLDRHRLEVVARLLRTIVDTGTTLVLASHSSALISAVSDRTVSLDSPG